MDVNSIVGTDVPSLLYDVPSGTRMMYGVMYKPYLASTVLLMGKIRVLLHIYRNTKADRYDKAAYLFALFA